MTDSVCRGVCRMLNEMGFGTLKEFRLTVPRRVDVIALNDDGEFVIVEIKSSIEDYRGDQKWREYLPYCDRFFFGVPARFPHHVLPRDTGLIIADAFGAAIRRPAPVHAVNTTRRRRQLLRFALAASTRLQRLHDPVA
ncbi:MAG: MmcB family DNA repair protein [Pseudomonadota bacterium]